MIQTLESAAMPDGTDIERVHWDSDSRMNFPHGSCLMAYPISKVSLPGTYAPKGNEMMLATFYFPSEEMAIDAFAALKNGIKTLADYKQFLWNKHHSDCI